MLDLNDLLAKLPEIRERRRGISPTPWTQGEQFADGVIEIGGSYDRVAEVIGKADAAFIAAAPSDIDTLLELVDRQFATIDRLLNDHEPHIAALEKRLAVIEADDHPRALERDATALDWEMVAVYPEGTERVDSIGDEEWIKARTAESNWRVRRSDPRLTVRWIARPRGSQRIIREYDTTITTPGGVTHHVKAHEWSNGTTIFTGLTAEAEQQQPRYAVEKRYEDSTRLLAGFDTESEAARFALETSIDGTRFYLAVRDRERKRDVFIIGNGFTTGDDPVAVSTQPDLPMKWWHLPEFGPFTELDTEGQRDNSYGPFDTREEAQADWLKVINGPPPGEDGAS